jgi:DNA-binding CsgD family transcriptional regulator/tetratricopeptide (TPR) repeat protein
VALDAIFRPDFEPDSEPCPRSRAEALAEFGEVLVRDSPKFKVVEISGDRWSGKTMVLQDFADLAIKAGWRVAAGSATSSQAGTAFGAFGEALNELIGSFAAEIAPIFPPVHVRCLAEIFPALETSPQPPQPVGSANLYKVLNAIGKLIDTLCTFGNLVLLLDDMHWADEATMNLLAHLLRYPPNGALIVVLAHRPRQSSHNLRGVINAAAAHGVADRIALAPLERADALALLPDDFSNSQCTGLLNESGGNPGLLRALAGLRVVPGQSVSAPPSLPAGVLAACLRDFRALSELGRLVAQAAAVLEEPFEPDMLKVVAQLDDAQVRAGVDELVGEDLICSDRSFPRLRFVNPLLRAAAYQSAGYGWLIGAQAKAAELLASRGKPAGQVARHLAYASAIGDEGSARFLLRAARESLWLDPAQAAFWVSIAADLQAGSTANESGSQLLLGKALALAGRLTKALKVLEELTEHNPGDHCGWAEAVSWRAWARFLTGWPDQSTDELTAALSTLPHNELAAIVELRKRRLILALESGAQPTEDDEAGLSSHLASTSGMPAAELSALLAAAACHRRATPARRYAAAAAESFDKVADEHVVRHLEGLYWLAQAQSALGDHEAALACCERGVLLTEQRQMGGMLPRFAAALAECQLSSGDLNGAARHAACALTAAALTGSDHLVAIASAVKAKVRQAERFATVMPKGPRVARLDKRSAASRDRAAVTEPAVEGKRASARYELDSLSGRELQVALLVSQGRTNAQIARRLGLSIKTVETYLARIFKKLVVSCRAEVATMVGRSTH